MVRLADPRASTAGRVDTRSAVLVRAAWAVAVLAGWCCWVWFSGRSWSHQPPRRWVRRKVRAVGNWCVTALVVGLAVNPAATLAGTGLALASLVVAVLVWRHRWQLRDLGWSVAGWLGWPTPGRDECGRYARRVRARIDGEARR